MCQSCDDFAAGEIDTVTADVCDDAETPYAPAYDHPEVYKR